MAAINESGVLFVVWMWCKQNSTFNTPSIALHSRNLPYDNKITVIVKYELHSYVCTCISVPIQYLIAYYFIYLEEPLNST
jgi:hypothetical protein